MVRAYLAAQDFILVDPPGLQLSPGNETHLHAFSTTAIGNDGVGRTLYLHTSPEFSMKKLLAAGERRIASLGHVWRNRERGALHSPEFTMLEWYRAGEPYEAVMHDCLAMLRLAAETAGAKSLRYRDRTCNPFAEPERLSVVEAFSRHAGIDLLASIAADGTTDGEALARQLHGAGMSVPAEYTWSYLFSRVLVEKIEPNLGLERVTILDEYPAAEAALARKSPHDGRVAERFEVYACGVELANGFGELTNGDEQRKRFTPGDGRKAAALWRALSAGRGLPESARHHAGGVGHRPGVRPAGNAGNRGAAHRSGHLGTRSGDDIVTIHRPIKTAEDLADAGLIGDADRDGIANIAARYAIAITPAIEALIDRSDPNDPIARQFVPDLAELTLTPEERADPIGDLAHSPVEGIVHRYPDRLLLKAVHVCPVYCRFCFRREMVGPQGLGTLSPEAMDAAFAYIAAHTEIWEVILTGGDPLVLSPRRLAAIMERLAKIDHVRIVRFHTRVPVVDPDAIDADLIAALKSCGKTVYVALHANHPRELSATARAACARLVDAGIVMVSQSVLLKGVNDDVETLAALMRAFVETRIKPYYLNHPDLAPGTGHFRLSIEEGQKLVAALRGRISGLCQPTYILDIPGGHGKADIGAPSIAALGDGRYSVTDFRGQSHDYPPPNAD